VSTLVKVAKSKSSSLTKYHTLIWFQLLFIFFKEEITEKNNNSKANKYFKTIIIERFDEILEPILLLISN
jgi:GH35 family endo-1,4-beta-xylanase